MELDPADVVGEAVLGKAGERHGLCIPKGPLCQTDDQLYGLIIRTVLPREL